MVETLTGTLGQCNVAVHVGEQPKPSWNKSTSRTGDLDTVLATASTALTIEE